jgi:hypothetical protein
MLVSATGMKRPADSSFVLCGGNAVLTLASSDHDASQIASRLSACAMLPAASVLSAGNTKVTQLQTLTDPVV